MFRKLNLLAFLMVILTLSSLAQASGPRGHRRGPESKGVEARTHAKRHPLELTSEQRQAIDTKVREMREAEANRSEIKSTVNRMLESFGVEPPESKRGNKRGGFFFDQLTEEQKLQIDGKVKEMREAGASRQEIRQQINATLIELGIEVPAKSGKGRGQQLSSEQKAMVKQLLAKGTSPTTIRQAVAELAIIDSAVAAAPSRDSSVVELRFITLGQVKMNSLK